MLPRNDPNRIQVAFDDHRLVANAGLILPVTLAQHLGLGELVDNYVDLGDAPGRADVGDKMMTLVASVLAGGDCIDDTDALRAGGTEQVLGCVVKAPSTLGTFLRSFQWGHVRQLDRVSREVLAQAWAAGAGPGDDPLTIDLVSGDNVPHCRLTLTLGQVRTEEKSTEITAIPQLLNLLDLQGCIVTIDAMGCQREIAQQITDGEADYVLAVKENQGQPHEGIRDLFAGAEALGFDGVPYDYSQTVNKGHGRVERRECWAITETDCLDYINPHGQWPQLNAAIKVIGHRETAADAISQPRYYISSRAAPAGQLLAAVRSHWSIENSLHWTLDVTFREDQCRVRKAHGPQNLATLRQISHNLLKNENTLKVGIQGKRLNTGWDEHYLLKVLLG